MEVPVNDERLRCFIGVYSIITNDGALKIHVRMFGIDRKFLDNDWDVHEEDVVGRKKEIVYGLPELESIIVRWGQIPQAWNIHGETMTPYRWSRLCLSRRYLLSY